MGRKQLCGPLEDVNESILTYRSNVRMSPSNYVQRDDSTNSSNNSKIISFQYDRFLSFHNDKLKSLNRVSNAFVTEVYTWGTNLNYTSGFASATGKSRPELLEFFEKKNEVIIEVRNYTIVMKPSLD